MVKFKNPQEYFDYGDMYVEQCRHIAEYCLSGIDFLKATCPNNYLLHTSKQTLRVGTVDRIGVHKLPAFIEAHSFKFMRKKRKVLASR